MTRSGSTTIRTPRPSQVGQAPNGELNENSRGSISGRLTPHVVHAKCSEYRRSPCPTTSTIASPCP